MCQAKSITAGLRYQRARASAGFAPSRKRGAQAGARLANSGSTPPPCFISPFCKHLGAAWGQAAEGSALTLPAYRAEPSAQVSSSRILPDWLPNSGSGKIVPLST